MPTGRGAPRSSTAPSPIAARSASRRSRKCAPGGSGGGAGNGAATAGAAGASCARARDGDSTARHGSVRTIGATRSIGATYNRAARAYHPPRMQRSWQRVVFARLGAGLAAAALAATIRGQAPPKLPPDLDARVQQAMAAFGVPGLALAIVGDDRVELTRGYGVQHLGQEQPVDELTRFCIASNTKVFTATALALIAEAGQLALDAPVQERMPWFQLADPFVSRELSVRDLLVHRSGLPLGAGDLLWWPGTTYDRREVVRRLRHVPLATSLRSAYAYDNVLYLAAGELIADVSGLRWEDFVQQRILDRVGMRHTTPRYDADPAHGA